MKRLIVVGLVIGAGLAVFVVLWFQPQKLVIDRKVSEAAPTVAAPKLSLEPNLSGMFQSLAHDSAGTATALRVGDRQVLRFENFSTSNGPDVVVYLTTADVRSGNAKYTHDFVDLGPLKGNIGDQNYDVPSGTDLTKYHTVLVWCRRFSVAFAAAALA